MTFDSEKMGFNDLSEATDFALHREFYQIDANPVTKDNITYNKSDTTGICSYVGNYTHKNVLISTNDEDLIVHIIKSMHLSNENKTNDTVVN